MLTPADDYPLHQTPDPIALAGNHRNFYDRFFFNGYHPQNDIFFAFALGVYPQLNIMDASVSLSIDGTQYNLRSSKEMNMDRLNLKIGPLRLDIAEPLKHTIITIDENDFGLSGRLEACARHRAIEEPRFTRYNGSRLFMDYTRLTQNLRWEGFLTLKGKRIDITDFLGTRDRSWGIRPIGVRDPQPELPITQPQFYWLWMPTHFENHAFFAHCNDDEQGVAWNRLAVWLGFDKSPPIHFNNIAFETTYHQNSRRVQSLAIKARNDKGQACQVDFKTTGFLFYMNGLGYTHPEWNHGLHHGALKLAFDEIDLSQAEKKLSEGAIHNLHVQALSEARLHYDGRDYEGRGVIEQLLIGAHQPSGFQDFLDGVMG